MFCRAGLQRGCEQQVFPHLQSAKRGTGYPFLSFSPRICGSCGTRNDRALRGFDPFGYSCRGLCCLALVHLFDCDSSVRAQGMVRVLPDCGVRELWHLRPRRSTSNGVNTFALCAKPR